MLSSLGRAGRPPFAHLMAEFNDKKTNLQTCLSIGHASSTRYPKACFYPDQQYCISGKEQSLCLGPKFIPGVHLSQGKVVYL